MNTGYMIINYVALLFSISVHECSHAWTANRFGDSTAKRMGRVTLNPIPHIDLLGTIILPALMIFSGTGFLIGWAKPVPVNPSNLKNPRNDNLWISFAGPLSNLLMGTFFAIIFHTLIRTTASMSVPGDVSIVGPLIIFIYFSIKINVFLAIFNLIPIFPLDGSGVLEGLLPVRQAISYEKLRPYGFMILLLLVYSNVLNFIIVPVSNIVFSILGVD